MKYLTLHTPPSRRGCCRLLLLALVLALPVVRAWADQSVTLAWDPNPEPDVSGYFVYYGTNTLNYPFSTNVGNVTTATVYGLQEGQVYYFAIAARNSSGLESDYSNEVTNAIPAVNAPLTLDPIPDLVLLEDAGRQSVSLTNLGSRDPARTTALTVTARSSRPEVIPDPIVEYTSPNSTGRLLLAPSPNAHGTASITVMVADGDGVAHQRIRTFTITVKPVNDPPTMSAIVDQNILEDGSTAPLAFRVGDLETAATNLSVFINTSDEELVNLENVQIVGTGTNRTVTVTPLPNQFGSVRIFLIVFDTDGGFAIADFTVNVQSVNDAPTISAIDNQTNSSGTPTGLIPFSVSDLETAAGSLAVSATSANQMLVPNANILLGGSSTNRALRLTPVAGQIGNATITVTVQDGSGGTVSDSFLLTVQPLNHAPTLAALDDLSLTENAGPQTVILSGISLGASDENQTLFIVASSSNPTLVPHPAVSYTNLDPTGTLVVRPAAYTSGTAVITVTVNDGQTQNNTASRQFTVTVSGKPLRLTIRRAGADVVVTRPYPASGYVLERSLANTTPWVWTTVDDTPTMSGNQQSVTLHVTVTQELYRLFKPAP